MKILRGVLILGSFVVVVAGLAGCGDDDDKGVNPQNHPPVVLSMTADPDTFYMYGSTTITVEAEDADDDPLNYSWDCNLCPSPIKYASASGNTAVLTNCCEIQQITEVWAYIIVDDGQGGEARDSVFIVVRPGE